MLIAIIEDNEGLRTNLVDLFNHYNYKTVFAENGEEGLALIINQHPDLVITDIMMPKLNGIEMIEMLKKTKRFQHIPIIFLTAKDASDDRLIGYKTGAIDYISKPYNTDELLLKTQNLFILAESQKLNTFSKPDDESFESNSEAFLQNLRIVIDQNLAASEFGAETIALELNCSSSAIRKKIKRITDKTANQFIREYRLEKAKQMLLDKHASVSEIAFRVGFTSVSYFCKSFKQYFNINPTQIK